MNPKIIEKRSDDIAQRIRQVRDGKKKEFIFCEGTHVVDELFKSGLSPANIYCTKPHQTHVQQCLSTYEKQAVPITLLTDAVMEYVSDLKTPPGIIALAKRPNLSSNISSMTGSPLLLILYGLQLPQNVGGLLRSAEAAGVHEVWVTEGSADVFGPKSIRASSGSVFRLPVAEAPSLTVVLDKLHQKNIQPVVVTQGGKKNYYEYDWRQPVALVVGPEGAGFGYKDLELIRESVRVPMLGKVESLNVGSATAVCLFEAARQRQIISRK